MTRQDISHPDTFKDGVRVLLLMLRAKDGGSAKTDRKATKKVVTQTVAEFDEALSELRSLWQPDQRIYATINPRDLAKAQRIFNFRLLEANYFDPVDRDSFYLDLENRWISSLKTPKASARSLFLFDVDNDNEKHKEIIEELYASERNEELAIRDLYETRNGVHIITTPFNPHLVSLEAQHCIHRDALMLWSY